MGQEILAVTNKDPAEEKIVIQGQQKAVFQKIPVFRVGKVVRAGQKLPEMVLLNAGEDGLEVFLKRLILLLDLLHPGGDQQELVSAGEAGTGRIGVEELRQVVDGAEDPAAEQVGNAHAEKGHEQVKNGQRPEKQIGFLVEGTFAVGDIDVPVGEGAAGGEKNSGGSVQALLRQTIFSGLHLWERRGGDVRILQNPPGHNGAFLAVGNQKTHLIGSAVVKGLAIKIGGLNVDDHQGPLADEIVVGGDEGDHLLGKGLSGQAPSVLNVQAQQQVAGDIDELLQVTGVQIVIEAVFGKVGFRRIDAAVGNDQALFRVVIKPGTDALFGTHNEGEVLGDLLHLHVVVGGKAVVGVELVNVVNGDGSHLHQAGDFG